MKQTDALKLAEQDRLRRAVLQHSDKIPPLPDVVLKMLALINRGDAEPREFEAVLRHSPALAGKILGVVNSALFALKTPITSIHDAVVMLGQWPLRNMVMAHGAGDLMLTDFSCYGHSPKGLWHHSVAVAAAARHLASAIGLEREEQEQMFLAGLLHDVGKMLIAPYLSARQVKIAHFPGDISAMEHHFTGLDHTEAGALVVSKWGLPATIQEVIKHQHGGEGPPDYRTDVAVLRLAESAVHEMGVGYLSGQVPEARYRPEDLAALGASGEPGRWEKVREEMATAAGTAVDAMADILSSASTT